MPELAVTMKGRPRITGGGKTLNVKARCVNEGTGAAPSFQSKAYLSRDSSVGPGDTLILDRRIDALAAGAETAVSFKHKSGVQLKRLYRILQVDPDSALAESDNRQHLDRAPAVSGRHRSEPPELRGSSSIPAAPGSSGESRQRSRMRWQARQAA